MECGEFLLVETKTKNNVFGTVLYRLDSQGIKCRCGSEDAMRFIMVSASGTAFKDGHVVIDCEKVINSDIIHETSLVLKEKEAEIVKATLDSKRADAVSEAQEDSENAVS